MALVAPVHLPVLARPVVRLVVTPVSVAISPVVASVVPEFPSTVALAVEYVVVQVRVPTHQQVRLAVPNL